MQILYIKEGLISHLEASVQIALGKPHKLPIVHIESSSGLQLGGTLRSVLVQRLKGHIMYLEFCINIPRLWHVTLSLIILCFLSLCLRSRAQTFL